MIGGLIQDGDVIPTHIAVRNADEGIYAVAKVVNGSQRAGNLMSSVVNNNHPGVDRGPLLFRQPSGNRFLHGHSDVGDNLIGQPRGGYSVIVANIQKEEGTGGLRGIAITRTF